MPFGMNLLGGSDPNAASPQPDISTLPIAPPASSTLGTLTPAPPALPAAAPAAPPQPAPTPHEAGITRAIRAIMGTQVDYKVDPSTGVTVPVPVKASGPQIFRTILGSALAGMAAGSAAQRENPWGGFAQGFASGGEGAMRQSTAVDAARRARAQEDFKNQLEIRKENRADQAEKREQQMADAHTAFYHVQTLGMLSKGDMMSPENLQPVNALNQTRREAYEEKNAAQPAILVNGKNINGVQGNERDFMAAYNSGAISHQASIPNARREVVPIVDTSGLKWDMETQRYLDRTTGQPVDMSSRTTLHVYDVPYDLGKEMVTISGKAINDAAGYKIVDPGDTKQVPLDQALSLASAAMKVSMEKQKLENENLIARKELAAIGLQSSNLKRQAEAENRAEIGSKAGILQKLISDELASVKETLAANPEADLTATRKKIDGWESQLNDLLTQFGPTAGAGGKPGAGTPGGGPPPPAGFTSETWRSVPSDVQTKWGVLPNADKVFWGLSKSGLPLKDQVDNVNASANLTPKEKIDVVKRLYSAAGQKQVSLAESMLPRSEKAGAIENLPPDIQAAEEAKRKQQAQQDEETRARLAAEQQARFANR